MADDEHWDALRQGSAAWHHGRQGPSRMSPGLGETDLTGANHSDTDLSETQ